MNPSQSLRKEDLEVRIIEEVQAVKKRSTSLNIEEPQRRLVSVDLLPIAVNSDTEHLLNEEEKNFHAALRHAGTQPYPTHMTKRAHTIFPITEQTVIKVVLDIQPRYPQRYNSEKGKKKLYPEGLINDLTQDQINEEVRRIDEVYDTAQNMKGYTAQKMKGTFIPYHISQEPGSSGSRSTTNERCVVLGELTKGTYRFIKFGDHRYTYGAIVQEVMRIRPLCTISSLRQVVHLVGRKMPRLPIPDDINLSELNLSVQPRALVINEQHVLSDDAYSTSIACGAEQKKDEGTTLSDLREEIVKLRRDFESLGGEVKEIKAMMSKILKHLQS